MKTIRYNIEYGLFLILRALVKPMPASMIHSLAQTIGAIVFSLSAKRRKICRINLDIAFGDNKTASEKNRIMKASCIQLVLTALQCLWISHNPEKRTPQLIDGEPEGMDIVKECLSRGKGVLFLTAHYGNWEVMGVYHGLMNIGKLHSIARKLDNPYLESFILKLRTHSGNGIFYKDQSPIKMVRALKRNECVAVMMDQNAGDWGTFVDFFGKKASTTRSLPLLSYTHGIPILPMFCYPTGKGTYRIVYGPELKLKKTGNKDEDVKSWTADSVKFLEEVLQKQPEPWLWIHRRWKSRPEEDNDKMPY